jgi:hypothetical protein
MTSRIVSVLVDGVGYVVDTSTGEVVVERGSGVVLGSLRRDVLRLVADHGERPE